MALDSSDDLQELTATPTGQKSLFDALQYAASTGLSLNPLEGKAVITVYNTKNKKTGKFEKKAGYQIMKNGLIELAMETKKVSFITSDTVRDNDYFDTSKSMEGDKFEFKPALRDRGEVIGFFAAMKETNGTGHVKWMTVPEVEEHAEKYSKQTGQFSAWGKSFNGMGEKTVMKALLNGVELQKDDDDAPDVVRAAIHTENQSFATATAEVIEVEPEPVQRGTSAGDVAQVLEATPETTEQGEGFPEDF
jgi:phage RecT family recombinase